MVFDYFWNGRGGRKDEDVTILGRGDAGRRWSCKGVGFLGKLVWIELCNLCKQNSVIVMHDQIV